MLKFIRGKDQKPTVDRQKLQKELFAYRKTTQHGFPHKPTAISYDPILSLMAIGTQTGAIKVFGKPGVEFYGQHTSNTTGSTSECTVQLLEWIPGSGRILSLTTANQLVLWEPADSMLVPIKSLSFDGKLKKVSSLCCSSQKDIVWIGTEGGNVYQFDIEKFAIKEPVIYHDVVFELIPPTYKLNPGAIECVRQLPKNPKQLLIVYNRGLCVLWNLDKNTVERSYISPGHGESVGVFISPDGNKFTWYHGDGSFATWDLHSDIPPKSQNYVPYGPDPCKAITRLVKGRREQEDVVVFSGGMPRSAYGDHQCVSVHCGDGTKVAFDFTSRVIDFFVTADPNDRNQLEVLVVLLEEELIAVDLTLKSLQQIKSPYLHSLHASAVTCNHLVSDVTYEVYEKILTAGQFQNVDYSPSEWPIRGGELPEDNDGGSGYEILLTGHEDGSVRFWDCTGVVLTPLLQFKSAVLFGNIDQDLDEHIENLEPEDTSEPPFRKAGLFDPYSDDARFAVKKISFCAKTGVLVVAGTAGHVVTATFDASNNDSQLKVTTINLVSDRDGFVWKGHEALKVRQHHVEDGYTTEEGIHVVSVLQVLPPAAITCVALESEWNLLAAGTAHGLVIFDFSTNQAVLQKCTLNPADLTGDGEQLSRRKSFKKTLRESFRRLRRGRSTRNNPNTPAPTTIETRPIERQVEARPVNDGMGSMVRCLAFSRTYIRDVRNTEPTLWSATNSSTVSVYVLNIPEAQEDTPVDQRKPVTGQLAKEIQLKHRAPVVGIGVVNVGFGQSPHRLVIASEEQFKVFTLPQLKPVTKYKLTANEGARVRRMSFATFSCPAPPENASPTKSNRSDNNISGTAAADQTNSEGDHSTAAPVLHTELGLLCLTNLGDCLVLSLPELKRQLNVAAIRREDINAISSLCFTSSGEALYMLSSSEIQRITLSATKLISPEGLIELDQEVVKSVFDEDDEEEEEEGEDEAVGGAPLPAIPEVKRVIEEKTTFRTIKIPADGSGIENNHHRQSGDGGLTNGYDTSPNKANETITSSIGDITIDSVRDHLNSTTTTLCSTTTEEIVGRISVLSTQTNETKTIANVKDLSALTSRNINDLSDIGNTTESNSSSVVIRSVITSVNSGSTNSEPEKHTTVITRKESQF